MAAGRDPDRPYDVLVEMFDIGAGELLVVALVALVVLQPRDLPKLMRSLGGALAMLRRRQVDLHRMLVTMEREGDEERPPSQ